MVKGPLLQPLLGVESGDDENIDAKGDCDGDGKEPTDKEGVVGKPVRPFLAALARIRRRRGRWNSCGCHRRRSFPSPAFCCCSRGSGGRCRTAGGFSGCPTGPWRSGQDRSGHRRGDGSGGGDGEESSGGRVGVESRPAVGWPVVRIDPGRPDDPPEDEEEIDGKVDPGPDVPILHLTPMADVKVEAPEEVHKDRHNEEDASSLKPLGNVRVHRTPVHVVPALGRHGDGDDEEKKEGDEHAIDPGPIIGALDDGSEGGPGDGVGEPLPNPTPSARLLHHWPARAAAEVRAKGIVVGGGVGGREGVVAVHLCVATSPDGLRGGLETDGAACKTNLIAEHCLVWHKV